LYPILDKRHKLWVWKRLVVWVAIDFSVTSHEALEIEPVVYIAIVLSFAFFFLLFAFNPLAEDNGDVWDSSQVLP